MCMNPSSVRGVLFYASVCKNAHHGETHTSKTRGEIQLPYSSAQRRREDAQETKWELETLRAIPAKTAVSA